MTDPSPSPQRHATRAPIDRPARLQFDDSLDVVEARCRNISIGGMFVITRVSRAAGSLVRFELDVDEGAAIRGLAEVVWMRTRDGGPGREPGMGVKFRFLEQRDRQQIFKLVSQHIKDRLANRQPFADPDASGVAMARQRDPDSADAGPTASTATPTGVPSSPPGFGPPPVSSEGRTADASATNVPRLWEPAPAVPEPMDVPPDPEPPTAESPAAESSAPEEVVRSSLFEPGSGLASRESGQQTLDFEAENADTGDFGGGDFGGGDFGGGDFGGGDLEGGPARPFEGEAEKAGGEIPISTGPSGWDGDAPDLPLDASPSADDLPLGSPLASSGSSPGELAMSAGSDWLDEPMGNGAEGDPDVDPGAEDPYFQHLGDDHFDHRPSPRRELPILAVAALALILVAALTYLFGDRIFDWSSGSAEAPVEQGGGTEEGAPVGEPGAEEGASEGSEPTPDGAGSSADTPTGSTATAPEGPSGAPASTPPPPPRPAPVPPSRERPSDDMFRALSDISWQATAGGLEIVLTTDGLVPRTRVKQFRLEDPPREAIRLLGVPARFDQPTVTVGEGGVRQIRTGWHRRSGGSELHVVLDLASPSARVANVGVDGSKVILTVRER